MKNHNRISILGLLLLSMILLGACSAGPERSRKPSDDWARGLLIGEDAVSTVAMTVDDDGERIHALWAFSGEDGQGGLRYVQLARGTVAPLGREVLTLQGQVSSPYLLQADEGLFHVLWTNRTSTAEKWQLWYAQMDQDGQLVEEPRVLSAPEAGVLNVVVAQDGEQGMLAIWEGAQGGGIMLTRVSPLGEKQTEIRLVADAGHNPGLAVDEEGRIHVSWLDPDNQLFYVQVASLDEFPVQSEPVYRFRFGTGASLEGPSVGVAGDDVYLFWSVLNQSGLEAGTAKTEYLVLQQEDVPRVVERGELGILPLEEQPYQPEEGLYGYQVLVPASYVNRTSAFVYEPSLVQNPTGEMAVAVAMQQDYRLDAYIQMAVAILEDGAYKGYALATKTQAISSDPILVADGTGQLHLLWRDGFAKEDVYYTTTDPETRAVLDRPMLRDVTTLILAGGMESLAGIMLFPLAFPWLFPGLVLVVVWRLIKNDENVQGRISQIILAIAIVLYQASKVAVFPTMVAYVPFSAWVDIPPAWALPLRIAIPLLIFGTGIFIAERLRRGRKSPPSTLLYYFVVVIVDMVLTLAIYGVNFLGAY